jgi:virginiamycin B lyase
MKVLIPSHPRHARGRQLRPYFVATTTQGIQILVYAHGTRTTPLAITNAGVGPTSPLCLPVTGGRSCTVPAAAPAGDDDFVVKTYDAQPVQDSFARAKQLAIGSTTLVVVDGRANGVNLTVGGVVAKAAIVLASPIVPVIDRNSQLATVSARDADGNTIVSDGWWDVDGNPVTIALSASNTTPVVLGFAPASVTFASPGSTITYVSNTASSAQVQDGFTSTITATPGNAALPGTAILSFAAPRVSEFPILTPGSAAHGIVAGPDNAMWFAERNGNNIGRLAVDAAPGTSPVEFPVGGLSPNPEFLALGSDGNIWFTESGNGTIGRITPATHAVSSFVTPWTVKNLTTSVPWGIAAGPDRNLWFTEQCGNNVASINPNTQQFHEYPASTTAAELGQIAAGPDGRLWFTEIAPNTIGAMTTAGAQTGTYPVPTTTSIGQGGIATGSDGALWFAECYQAGNNVGRIPIAGSPVTEIPVPTANASPTSVASGPDGALWFVEYATDKIGRVDPLTHHIDEFPLPSSAVGRTRSPYGIAVGPDGALWFTEFCGNNIGKLQ